MKLFDTVWLAVRSLARNTMRTLLTMLGLIIGVAAVITMLALGNGAKTSVQASIASLGTNTLMVSSGSVNQGGVRSGAFGSQTLKVEDADAISEQSTLVSAVSPLTQNNSQVVYRNRNWSTSIQGTGVDFPFIRNWTIGKGRFFTPNEVRTSAKVCILGQSVVEALF